MTESAISLNWKRRRRKHARKRPHEWFHAADPSKVHDVLTYALKVNIYEDRVRGWFLGRAKQVHTSVSDSGFIVLAVALSYIEGAQQFREGKPTPKKKSGEWFKDSARRLLGRPPSARLDDQLQLLWSGARCGLFHTGMTKPQVRIDGSARNTLTGNKDRIVVNPLRLLNAAERDLTAYVRDLRASSTSALAHNFVKYFDSHGSSV